MAKAVTYAKNQKPYMENYLLEIIETASDYVIFESRNYRYCFEYQQDEGVVLYLAA